MTSVFGLLSLLSVESESFDFGGELVVGAGLTSVLAADLELAHAHPVWIDDAQNLPQRSEIGYSVGLRAALPLDCFLRVSTGDALSTVDAALGWAHGALEIELAATNALDPELQLGVKLGF